MDPKAPLAEDLKEVDKIVSQPTAGPKIQKHENQLRGYTIKSLVHLIKSLEKLDRQNQQLEERNIALQSKMLYLTYVMGAVAIITFLSEILLPVLRFFFPKV